jgi:hypothetical protein
MNGSRRGLWAGATFLLGFAGALWFAGAALGELRGPRAGLMRELNELRRSASVPVLRPDGALGRVAQEHASDLARDSALALALAPIDLERAARRQGWRGRGPLRQAQVRGSDPASALREAFPTGVLADPDVRSTGVGLAPAPDGQFVAVVLLAQ